VLRSIGYRGIPVEGVPFDERSATIPNAAGRILDEQGVPIPGEYAVGWIKRGPTGIIGTNKRDAQQTVDALLADLDADRLNEPADPSREALEELLDERKPEHVTYTGWEAIDRVEKEAGEPHGRPRVKLTTTEELLEAARERVG
jgi:ferredoxin--NADP+ reductase